ncbi:unnamed protein product [Kuraishia capsulata CBS 1993]|uniref:Endonuclease/exonuclease/phosphatase domain-containing protein n=1 Tax=Kuraishia capsulata CBS 1993 TaxID=1382522 RepID=W6MXC5_9ASCO|nr:uncharacterized protein KUCA_T00004634001 [Kuraishia capsulata CBS 1993]CDK28650.1 unnamed protein product [Kuraishia capsulata CBS 1993]
MTCSETPASSIEAVEATPQEQVPKLKKKKAPRRKLTPEEIEEVRKQKQEERRLKREAQAKEPQKLAFITRDLKPIHSAPRDDQYFNFKIMTYNLLAQSLIRRSLFPTNGSILKWINRAPVLLSEIAYYDSDIMCFQEMDYIQYKSYWSKELEKLGYANKFYRQGVKNHGIAIFWKSKLFESVDSTFYEYDLEDTGKVQRRTFTQNVGLIVALKFAPEVYVKYPQLTSKGLFIGTSHLFWHPFGTYERTRQTYLALKKCQEFADRVKSLRGEDTSSWLKFFCGDLNSQPFDSPYLSVTSKPVKYDGRCKKVIACSTSFQYSQLRAGGDGEDEEGGNVEKFGEGQPQDPVPENFDATEEQVQLVKDMEDLHNSLPVRAISLYAVGYRHVHPENAGRDNEKGEPFFSNWAHTWRGLLDYIMLIKPWNGEPKTAVETVDEFEAENNLRLNGLLYLPTPEEMGPEPSGQPRQGQYPSDHLCIVADIGIRA